ncbi:hypothetical protein [Nonomuraea sp. NPDC052265]|uniref:hypothetical protein n=1 Tax=Nonomuraea sp. NPDC052265 TaxID=3364374 RepID=UPI0037C52679
MIVSPGPRPSLGRAFGETARLIGKLHRRALADFDSDFPTWMLLTLLKEAAAPLPVDDVVKELDRRLDLAEPETVQVLDRAAAAGHITYRRDSHPATAELTEAGTDHFAALYAHAREVTDVAFAGIDPAHLDTALTVVLAARERAAAAIQ